MLRLWISEIIFLGVKFCLTPFIKYEVEFEEGVSKELLNKSKVIYAFPEYSVSELVALDKYTNQLNIPSPVENFTPSGLKKFICLIRPRFDISEQKIKRFLPQNLPEILDLDDNDIELIPVSFYWGMHPEKQRSFFKILFSQSWTVSSPLKKFFRILFHGRSLIIKFNTPLILSEIKDKERTNEENSRLISRYLRALFRRSKQAAIGPDISHRRTLVKSLSKDKEVRKEIRKQSKNNQKKKKKLNKRAYEYANEICSDINYPIVRNLQRGLSWFWNRRYEGIHVKNLDLIKSIADKNCLIYVPCHRSHIDYLALSFVLLEKGLMLPHIAAGKNLNLPVLGGILRGGGAFFMRRSFVANKLYSLVFFQYFKRLLERGSSIEFFPEGGRSRSGFSLQARPGLLSMSIRSFSGLSNVKVKLVPTYIGYEKIIEGNSYLSELLGKRKKNENLLDIFRSVKDLRNFLGNAYIHFGKPIDLQSFLETELDKNKDFRIESPLDRPEWLRKATSSLGDRVMQGINSSAVLTTSSLFSLSLLTESTQSLDLETIKRRISMFINLIKENEIYDHLWLTEESTEKIISKTEDLGLIQAELIGGSKVYRPSKKEAALLSYYQNNTSHHFLLYSMICLALKYVNQISLPELHRLSNLIYPFLQSDFYLPWKKEEIPMVLEKCIKVLLKSDLIKEQKKGFLSKPEENSKKYRDYLALSNICESSIKRFYIVMSIVWKIDEIEVNNLQKKCEEMASKLQEIEGWLYTEFSDATKFKTFINKLLDDRYLKKNTSAKLTTSRITKKVQIDFERFFNKDFMHLVNQLN